MLDIGQVVAGIDDGQPEYGGGRGAAEDTAQQVQRSVRLVDAADCGAGKTPPQFRAHGDDRFTAIVDIGVPAFAKIDPQVLPVPRRSEPDLRAQEGLVAGGRSPGGRGGRGDVADQLLRHETRSLICITGIHCLSCSMAQPHQLLVVLLVPVLGPPHQKLGLSNCVRLSRERTWP
ncbi:MAG: hypothetical protein HQL31_00525, partial [Planctomycetes bacterium]|nr:hypothetical protein [Planctomycetota bacterium]